ncbi:2-oxoglutarate dehydrogenase E1 subunit family protein [Cellulomonas fimi]|uniref:2-oxoglutarate dehydrogenase E1 subunit family protein n=1 Tax=Cellulomonas fimi TaxID=1708 RepID=UPI0035AE14C3
MTQKAEPDSTRADFGANEWLVDELYEQFKQDRNAVDPAWWDFFEGYKPVDPSPVAPPGGDPC